MYHRINFYAKQVTRDALGASSDQWPAITITCRGGIRWTGGNESLSFSDERFFGRNMELSVRYNTNITETMKVQIDGTSDLYAIRYIEMIGRNEGLKLTLQKLIEQLNGTVIAPPTLFAATLYSHVRIDVTWLNNSSNDGVVIERSLTGNDFTEIIRIAKAIVPVIIYHDTGLLENTRYFYRIRAFEFYNYSAYTNVDDATTSTIL